MAGEASRVVYLWARQRCRDRCRFFRSLDGRLRSFVFLAGQVDLAERANAIGDCCLNLVDISRVGALYQVLHFESDNEDAEGGGGEYADYQ